MKQLGLSYYEHPEILMIPLIIFILFFVGLIFWVSIKSNRDLYKEIEQLPLEKEDTDYEQY